jgi:hypothetical protein
MSDLVKYPRTMHLPWSPGLQNDDRVIESLDGLIGQEVVVTDKHWMHSEIIKNGLKDE